MNRFKARPSRVEPTRNRGDTFAPDPFSVTDAMRPCIAEHLAQGGRLHQITRHMLGLFTGKPGARGERRVLSEGTSPGGQGLGCWTGRQIR